MMKRSLLTFHARSPERDAKIDELRLSSLTRAFDSTIREMAEERSGLIARVKALEISGENSSRSSRKPALSLAEFRRVEERVSLLARRISDCELLKDSLDNSWPATD